MKERFELKFDDKNNLIVYKWSNPDRPAIGCVQISHGLSEHITRYEDFANFLVSKGFTVIGDDHYQHGESCKDLSKLGKVEEYDFIDAMIKSLHLVREEFANDFQGITCLFSHSMGSITAQEYIQKYPNDFQKVILSGTDHQPENPLRVQVQRHERQAPDRHCHLRLFVGRKAGTLAC